MPRRLARPPSGVLAAIAVLAAGAAAREASVEPALCAEDASCFFQDDSADVAFLQRALAVDLARSDSRQDQREADAPDDDALLEARQPEADVEPTATKTTTMDPTGLTLNAKGDLKAFCGALASYGSGCLVMLAVFSVLRLTYPLMYANNAIKGTAPVLGNGLLSWVPASLKLSIDEVAEHAGLDQAMLLEFSHLGMKVLAIIGLPMVCVLGPTNYLLGGRAARGDNLSWLSFSNIEDGHWLFWLYAWVVWGVVLVVQTSIYKAQRAFLDRRFRWLRAMPSNRANTVLVEGIPEKFRSDQALYKFFEDVLPGDNNVDRAYVVKDTSALLPQFQALQAAQHKLNEAEATWAAAGGGSDHRPTLRPGHLPLVSSSVDSIEYWEAEVAAIRPRVAEERRRLEEAARAAAGVNLSSGFVTFASRVDAEIALRLDGISQDAGEWVLSSPPAPQDIQWEDLTQDPAMRKSRELVGYLLVGALYFAYMPLVIGVTNLAKIVKLGPLQPLWQGVAPTFGLQLMVAYLPTMIILIFTTFFTLKARQWAQHALQSWYFWFQLVFVILATALGQNVPDFTKALIESPLALFDVLATTMPYATHFYMNYMVLQWMTHCTNMIRYVQLSKFMLLRRIYDDEDSRALAEPEDQDYYGMGSRSTRWTIALILAIVFGTLSPLINALGFVNFVICRLSYGYLLVFAETKKTDLGGAFWVMQMRHLFIGLLVYCVLMTGVLAQRASGSGPMVVAGTSILHVVWSMRRFHSAFIWESLPLEELMRDATKATEKCHVHVAYLQPELQDTAFADDNLGRCGDRKSAVRARR